MWLAPVAQLLAVAAMAPQAGPAPISAETMPNPIATRQTVFAIPFRIDRPDQPSQEPVEVQLYVSDDLGRTWRLCEKVEPARGQFVFRAQDDREYWFAIRTLDRSGRLRPEQTSAPGLRVVVDTVPPALQLEAHRGQAGQITAQWNINEPHPNLDSLTVQYRTATGGPWQTVAVPREELGDRGTGPTGAVTWWPQAGSGAIEIRAEVADTAGNPAVSHAQVGLEPEQGPGPLQTANNDPAGAWRPSTPDQPATQYPSTGLTAWSNPAATNQAAGGGPPATYPPAGSVPAESNPAIQNQYVAPNAAGGGPAAAGLPPGERPRMVNSRLFELEYDVESVGPSGISRVELWGTQDGGRNWKTFTLDNDNRSPMLVAVDAEGIYGFRVVVQSGAGLGGKPPQMGDLPEVWVGVDLTQPTARILAAEPGTGPESGKLIISWQAHDAMPAARPISISFSESPGGPWTTVATGLENTGRYAWPIDGRVPKEAYLRLEARDEAGNVGVFETTESVALDRFRPSVHVRDVRPLGQSSRTLPKRYYFR